MFISGYKIFNDVILKFVPILKILILSTIRPNLGPLMTTKLNYIISELSKIYWWGCSLGYKILLKYTFHATNFHNRYHTTDPTFIRELKVCFLRKGTTMFRAKYFLLNYWWTVVIPGVQYSQAPPLLGLLTLCNFLSTSSAPMYILRT